MPEPWAILEHVAHRPFPLPDEPWVIRQSWSKLLFAHWPVKPEQLRPLIPESLEIDTYENQAFVAVVPFAMRRVYPRLAFEVPWLSNFLELNIRTYVKKDGIAGVYFFSLDCSNPVAVWVARNNYHLPYYNARMDQAEENGWIAYESRRQNSASLFRAIYRPTGELLQLSPSSLDAFLTERYCLYTTDELGHAHRAVIHHMIWPLRAAEAEIATDTLSEEQLGFRLPQTKPLLHYCDNIDTVNWSLKRLQK
jgi:uncharacterized protein YqjF (DUF2071 family)